jgi:hypothetical protein
MSLRNYRAWLVFLSSPSSVLVWGERGVDSKSFYVSDQTGLLQIIYVEDFQAHERILLNCLKDDSLYDRIMHPPPPSMLHAQR